MKWHTTSPGKFITLKSAGLLTGVVIFITILAFIDLEPSNRNITYTAAIALLMAIWWITEAIPLAATALLPVVLFPVLGVMNGKDISTEYFNHVIFLFLGGFIVALAMQRWELHRRIALYTLLIFGTKPRQILLGFMLTTAILSMWMSNTATAMMMVPIALSVILKIEQDNIMSAEKLSLVLLLGIAYSASIGGIATLVGTPPNLVLVRIFSISFPDAPEISFAGWFVFAFPIAISFLLLTWLFLGFLIRKCNLTFDKRDIRNQLNLLGKISYEEKVITVVFLLLILMWLTRAGISFGNFTFKGWSALFGKPDYINDGTVAVFFALLLFIIPGKRNRRIMTWKDTRDLPWNIVLLFGGGFALARGFLESGLSGWLGTRFYVLQDLNPILIVFILCFSISLLTELTSNTATSQVILPILAPLSITLTVNPLILMVPVTLASSLAFMMPVATPPNAIIFGTNRVKIGQMVRIGFLLNMLGVILATAGIFLLGGILGIDFFEFPEWAR